MTNYIWVTNPKGRRVEVVESDWPALAKKGFLKEPPIPEVKPADPNQADLNFVAAFQVNNGMGRVGEEVLLALDRLKLKINVIPLDLKPEGLSPRTLELIDRRFEPSDKSLFFCIPQAMEGHLTARNFLHVPWDTTKAPDIWVKLINQHCEKVYPVSGFTDEVLLNSGVTVPTKVIRHGVSFTKFPVIKRNWDRKVFVFLTCGDLSTRKGVDVLFEAFLQAFPDEKDVRLIVKSNHSLDWGKLEKPKDRRIWKIDQPLSPQKYLKLLKNCHVYVAPSRAEGFGLPALEAMSTGMPLVIHNWGGLCMMAHENYNFVVPSSGTTPAPAWHYPEEYSQGGGIGDWGEPDKDKLAELLRYLYEQRDKAKEKGELSAEWVRESWDWYSPVKTMWQDLSGQSTPTWGEFYSGSTLTQNNVQDCINSHKELFWIIKGFNPATVCEDGCGTAEMAAWLSWNTQLVEGRQPTPDRPQEVIAIDNDPEVIRQAKNNLKALNAEVTLIEGDAFTTEVTTDLTFSQGMLEHFTDEEMRRLVDNELKRSPVVIHSVPNNFYAKLDFGNERLLTNEEYYAIFADYDLSIYNYWPDDKGELTMSILVFKREATEPQTSIIMPVWNQADLTKNAIEAVRKHTENYELIVIDNGSTDGVSDWLDKQKDLRVVHLSRNLGVPGAKNLAMMLARGKYVCFLDNDTVAGKGWLTNLLSVFENPQVAFTGHEGYLVDVPGKRFQGKQFDCAQEVDWCSHSVFVFPRRLLRETGLLINRDLWCVEDVDQCSKFRRLGYIGLLPETPTNIEHLVSATAKLMKDKIAVFDQWYLQAWNEWEAFFKEKNEFKLDIGVGDAPAPGYTHVDIQELPHVEIVAPCEFLPVKENTVDEVRASHLLEHLKPIHAKTALAEWYRVLKPGGTLRIIVPDVVKISEQIVNGSVSHDQAVKWLFGGFKDEYDIHYWGFTAESLAKFITDSGFINVETYCNADGWLEATAQKPHNVHLEENQTKPTRLGFFNTHHHTYGGGEVAAFRLLAMLQNHYPDLELISEDYSLDLDRQFGIKAKPFKIVPDGSYDVFLNCSFFKLQPPKGKQNIAYVYYPMYDWKEEIKAYQQIVTISDFCKDEIKRKWDRDSLVIPPAVDINKFHFSPKKKQILSIGRFFRVKDGNNKCQELLVDAFSIMPQDWKLILVGTVQDEEYYQEIRRQAKGLNVEFIHDIPFVQLANLYAESKCLWHAAGYSADNPSGYEHFGIVAVEALASGCLPLVYGKGGIAQITGVETWLTPDELVAKTLDIEKVPLAHYRNCAKEYSVEVISQKWKGVVDDLLAKMV